MDSWGLQPNAFRVGQAGIRETPASGARQLPDADQYRVKKMSPGPEDYGSLHDYFKGMEDFRSRQGRCRILARRAGVDCGRGPEQH